LRAWQVGASGARPIMGVRPDVPTIETIVPGNFYEINNVSGYQKEEGIIWIHVHGGVLKYLRRRTPTK